MSGEIILQARGLGISFGGVDAVKAVDFDLRQGELRCLIGPNGAGKTTFFRLLSGQHTPTRGTITFRGRSLNALQPYQIARLGIGIKTQVPSLFEGLSIAENIEMAARRRASGKVVKAIVDDVLEHIGLGELRDRLCSELAHGQRQWVELGQILASKPAVALLDEPAAGMTHSESLKTVQIIRDITRESAVIVVEHDMDFIRLIGERVTVFERGAVIAEGSFEEIAKDPQVRAAYLGRKETANA
ncbi:ATP-binding cassette domain-containing protein [Aquamicrobium sp.]|uniref:ATP-binding cassette domain-containing protein n=1 Tax=Aquamicrobium sp. TaxID=1872579 RepID=UPI00258C5EE8|nr:ATP-binding cassette domain-containing protein [Aquamicrobium sp.]MCK9549941.1 ATP-binding cassette domain-containing protein [Aquamicrobium sp.]